MEVKGKKVGFVLTGSFCTFKKTISKIKTKNEINLSKAHKPTNSPWRKGLPHVVSHNSIHYAFEHGC